MLWYKGVSVLGTLLNLWKSHISTALRLRLGRPQPWVHALPGLLYHAPPHGQACSLQNLTLLPHHPPGSGTLEFPAQPPLSLLPGLCGPLHLVCPLEGAP